MLTMLSSKVTADGRYGWLTVLKFNALINVVVKHIKHLRCKICNALNVFETTMY